MQDRANTDVSWEPARRVLAGKKLSILVPVHDLQGEIAANLKTVHAAFSGKIDFEIVVVDDGSTDRTADEIRSAAGTLPNINPLYLKENVGKGAALQQAFGASSGDYVLFLDGDLDLPPQQVLSFFEILEREDADVVIGSKRHPASVLHYPRRRRVMSVVYYAIVKALIGLPIHDTQTGMKLFKRETLAYAMPRMLVKRFAFDLELLAIVHEKGFRIAEAPITLQFHARWGCVRVRTVRQTMNDTLAIFYRLRLLRYYQSLPDLQAPSTPPLVSIVIAYPQPSSYLEECLYALRAQAYEAYEILLLPDTASNRDWGNGVREIPTGRLRPAEKRNKGIKEAKGEIIAFLDDDTYPAEGWLQQAVAYFSDPAIAAVGGPAITPPSDGFLEKLSGRVYANPLVSGTYRYRYVARRVREVEDYPSCNLFVRADVLRSLHGFRTEFWPGEDTYLCLEIVDRMKKHILYDPRVLVFHHRRKLFLPHLRQIGRYALHRGYFARHLPRTSRKFAYMMPSLLVLGIVLGFAISFLSPVLKTLYLCGLAFYLGITFLAAAQPRRPVAWILTWLGIVATHLVYGTRFLLGLCGFGIPEDVRRFDHVSEKNETPEQS